MRRLLLILFFCSAYLANFAQSINDVVVWKKNGDSFICSLAEKPKITYENNYYTIKSSENKTEILFTDIWKVTFYKNESTKVQNELAEKSSLSFKGDDVSVKGAKPNELVALYSVSGKLIAKERVNSFGDATLSLSSLPNGIYIIKTSFSNFKITKK